MGFQVFAFSCKGDICKPLISEEAGEPWYQINWMIVPPGKKNKYNEYDDT